MFSRTFKQRNIKPYYTSRDPEGTVVASLTGVDIKGVISHGQVVTLRSNAGIFGSIGPELIRRIMLQPGDGGSDFIPTNGVNVLVGRLVKNGLYYQSSNEALRIPVHNVEGMPNGVAFAVGDKSDDPALMGGVSTTTSSLNVETKKYFTESFEHCYRFIPEANQDAIIAAAAASTEGAFTQFNTKQNWIGREGELYGYDNFNIYSGIFRFTGNVFSNPTLRVSNTYGQQSVYLPAPPANGVYRSVTDYGNGKVFPVPICHQIANKVSATDGYDALKLVALLPSNSLLCDYKTTSLFTSAYPLDYEIEALRGQPIPNEFNQHKMFGFTRGYGINWGFHQYATDHFLQFGEGARARVEIYDVNGVDGIENRISVMTPLYWSPNGTEVAFEVYSGIFNNETLIGKYMRVFNYLGEVVYNELITDGAGTQ